MQQKLTISFTLPVDNVLAYNGPTTLPGATAGTPYQYQLQAPTGGIGPYTWGADPAHPLPAGLSLSPSGLISGTPTVTGTFGFTGFVQDTGD